MRRIARRRMKKPVAGRTRMRKAKAKRTQLQRMAQMMLRRIPKDLGELRTATTIACGGTNATTFDTQIRCLSPNATAQNGVQISQGTGEGDRRGNKITVRRGVLKMLITPLPHNATTNVAPWPFIFKYWVVSCRAGVPSNTVSSIQTIQGDFFDAGNAVAGMTHTTADFINPINDDKWIVHASGERKVFWQEYIGTGGPGAVNGNGANNDFKAFARVTINYTKMIPKNIMYVDNSAVPTSKAVWLVFGCYRSDGAVLATDQRPLQVVIVNDFKFVA